MKIVLNVQQLHSFLSFSLYFIKKNNLRKVTGIYVCSQRKIMVFKKICN